VKFFNLYSLKFIANKKKDFMKLNIKNFLSKPINIFFIIVFCCVAYLAFHNLDNTYFWDDEANTALFAKNFLKYGKLTAWDGKNLICYGNSAELNKDLNNVYMPPLQYLTVALSFKILGVSTWAGRFPFVVMGLLSLLLFFIFIKYKFKDNLYLQIYALLLFGFSIVFLLNIRQCRYYSLTLFFPITTYFLYQLCLSKKNIIYFLLFSLSCILFFYSNWLLCIAFLLSLILVHIIFYRNYIFKEHLWRWAISVGIFCLMTFPYALYLKIWIRRNITPDDNWLLYKITLLWWNIRDLNLSDYFPWMLSVLIIVLLVKFRKNNPYLKDMLFLIILIFGFLFFLTIFSPQPANSSITADIRYLSPILPFILLLIGQTLILLNEKFKYGKIFAFLIIFIHLTTNILTLGFFSGKFKWTLPSFIKEIHNPYPTAVSETVKYLKDNVKESELVYAEEEFQNYPLMFYLGDKVQFGCLLDKNAFLGADFYKKLSPYLLMEENYPDWIIVFGMKNLIVIDYFSRLQEGSGIRNHYTLEKVIERYRLDTSRPELHWHHFGPVIEFDKKRDAVYIYKKNL
jgi:hypothetical protein